MSKTLCIYHKNCADGFGSAWVVRKALGETNVEFHAATYQQDPPDVTGREVLIVDFSYKREVMERMAQQATSITVLDHHKTAEAELQPLLDAGIIKGVFCNAYSGVMLTWHHFFPNREPNDLIKAVEDRDLWKFNLPHTKEIMATVFSHPYDFSVWDDLMNTYEEALISQGSAILRKQQRDVAELVRTGTYRRIIAGHDVPVLNAPMFYASDAGHVLAPGEKFAAVFTVLDDGIKFSLRSEEGTGMDVSEIASLFGGGGHQHAAGFFILHTDIEALSYTQGLQG